MSSPDRANPSLRPEDKRDRDVRRLAYEALESRQMLAGEIEQLYDVVHGIASSYIYCPATCDDVVQDTVIKVVDRWETIGSMSGSKQNAYIAKATRNTFVDRTRADAREDRLIEHVFAEGQRTTAQDPLDMLIVDEQIASFERWLAEQDGTDIKIWQLRHDGMTLEAVANELDIPKSTVQFRSQRMLESYFRQLASEDG